MNINPALPHRPLLTEAPEILGIYTLSFFNKYLKGHEDHLLDGSLADHPEIQNYTKK